MTAAPEELRFASDGDFCAAWRLRAEGSSYAGPSGRPCVVMAHGLGGTRDSGLLPFAEALAAAGLEVLLFDYRCFGASGGEPRQLASPPRHRRDYEMAVAFARGLDGVDPERIVLWGTSWSGGHVAYVAAADSRIAAVISQNPDLDGIRTLGMIAGYGGWRHLARLAWHGLVDQLRALRGADPHLIPTVGPPGTLGAMTSEESGPGYKAIAGPSWRNELTARAVLHEGRNRGVRRAARVRCPWLIQVCLADSVAVPSGGPTSASRAARAELLSYPLPHFGIYVGDGRERAIADQLGFLSRVLA